MTLILSNEGVGINNRFFLALDSLKDSGRIRGLQTFTRKYNLNRRNLISVKHNPETSMVKPEILAILVTEYCVSADWLLTGRGSMFIGSPSRT